MTQRNGIRGTSDCCLHMEASTVLQQANSMEEMQEANGHEHEERGQGGEGRHSGPVAVVVTAPDGGWGWVVVVATMVDLALTLGFPSCVGIFYTDLQNEFNASNSETSWVPSIMTSVLHAGGPLCSVLQEKIGCRKTVMLGGVLSGLGMATSSFSRSIVELYITAGVVTGLGFCFCFQPAMAIMGHYFVRRRVFVNALSSTGTAVGLCVLPFLGNYLHTEFGWRGSFLILGAVLLNCCVCGAVMRPLQPNRPRGQPLMNHGPPPPDEDNDGKEKGRVRTIVSRIAAAVIKHMAFDQLRNNRRYRVYSIGITWMMLGFVVPLVYLVPYATANGMEPSQAAFLLSILGIVNIVIRPPFGAILGFSWFKGRHIYAFAFALLINGLSNSICTIGASFPVLLVYVVIYGLSMSVVGSLMFTVLMDTVEMSRFPSALGLLSVMEAFTLVAGPPLAGALVDSTGHYYHVFLACSAVVSSAAVFLMVSFYLLDKKERRQGKPSTPPDPPIESAPGCQYRSVPTEGDRDKASANGAEFTTST
ncbi:monocarboxylate transporter 6 [Stegastes partitus]|uniref:Monocarboxylate transporter 6 n=2 Tax=Stegastes partitus TaxID=144197 RepID=A0A9Y4NLK5_9TELE|nr:PREDICTED: monocarboxylate transporter 6 [Stegastes partitus]